ncbi:MAG: alanine--tRNA ligase-related protein, partial [Bellilinea sp.]
MTELLYATDSFLKSFDARVKAVDEAGRAVLLDRTAFYPGGGGQPGDTGILNGANGRVWQVSRVRKTAEGIWHTLAGEAGLPQTGDALHGTLDWERRYALMRTHTALHILCG